MHDDLLELGLHGLANTPWISPGMWFHGHHGAAVLAAHFIRTEFALPREVDRAVVGFACSIVEQFPQYFKPGPKASPLVGTGPLVAQLEEVVTSLTADGHDVIFASLALKALQIRPDLATQAVVDGLVRLLQDAQNDNPKRYLGYDDYINQCIDYSNVPTFRSAREAARYALGLHDTVYPDQVIGGHHYYLAGNKLHDVTHAHALCELERLGFEDVATMGLAALRKQFHLCSNVNVPEGLEPFVATERLSPYELSFWLRGKRDAHHVKLAYSVMSVLEEVSDSEHRTVLDGLSKYWELLP
jgi:hypothetical protein